MLNKTLLAALDLGSNSFRLEIGQYSHGQIERVEYLKETVRQGNGLDANLFLSDEAMQRGWQCLERFAERLTSIDKRHVRAVATQTLREAKNRAVFLQQAQKILGIPVDVIAGREEARLIYQGVANLLPQSQERRLVIDIGGRSSEFILGQEFQARVTESYRLGSVAWSMDYFADGKFKAENFRHAEIAAAALLEEGQEIFSRKAWDTAYGASGTIGAVADILKAHRPETEYIDAEGLDWLKAQLLAAKSVQQLDIAGLREDRRAVIGGGLAIINAIFTVFKLKKLYPAQGALRQGVLYDMLDREAVDTDTRAVTVNKLIARFQIDTAQAQRVRECAQMVFSQIDPESAQVERGLRNLNWAAELHEIGSFISHSSYHKHGAYILENVDAAGFAVSELSHLSQLVLGHRGKLKKLDAERWKDERFVQQLLALRLAVILCHARQTPDLAQVKISVDKNRFVLLLPRAWAQQFPQSYYLLQEECRQWDKSYQLQCQLAD